MPVHASNVVVARIARQVRPSLAPVARLRRNCDNANAAGCVGAAGLGILELRELRIQPSAVVDEEVVLDPRGIELPEGDPLAVGTPAKAVVELKLLLVNPVKRAVDDMRRLGARELHDLV